MRTGQYVVDPWKYLEYKSHGFTDDEVADHCNVHVNTVRNNLYRLYKQMGAHNVAHAVALALSNGDIPKVTRSVIRTVPCEPAAA